MSVKQKAQDFTREHRRNPADPEPTEEHLARTPEAIRETSRMSALEFLKRKPPALRDTV